MNIDFIHFEASLPTCYVIVLQEDFMCSLGSFTQFSCEPQSIGRCHVCGSTICSICYPASKQDDGLKCRGIPDCQGTYQLDGEWIYACAIDHKAQVGDEEPDSEWFRFYNDDSIITEDSVGIYRICSRTPIPRLNGESEILYIGQGKIKHRLCKHIELAGVYFSKADVLLRVRDSLGHQLYCEFIVIENSGLVESSLLREYEGQHWELPPLNRSRT
jgi:hypothetical protein